MKQILIFAIALLALTTQMNAQVANMSLLEGKRWMLLNSDDSRRTYMSDAKNVTDKFTITFNNDGTFLWNTNPSCGTNIGEVAGTGLWSYKKESNYLLLDFKGIVTTSGEKKTTECYKIDSITNNTLALSKLMQCGKK